MPTAILLSSAAPSGTAFSVAPAAVTAGVQSKLRGSLSLLMSTDSLGSHLPSWRGWCRLGAWRGALLRLGSVPTYLSSKMSKEKYGRQSVPDDDFSFCSDL